MNKLFRRAGFERERTINPEEPPPHGDFPYLSMTPLDDLEQSVGYQWGSALYTALGIISIFAIVVACGLALSTILAFPRDLDDSFAGSPLKGWFDKLASGKGLCCSFADGQSIADVDWDTATVAAADGQSSIVYRVRINGEWVTVPPEAVVTEPNRFGRAVVWPYQDYQGVTQIRCFMPGTLS